MTSKAPYEKRLLKEPELFVKKHPQGMFVDADQAEQNLKIWIINIQGAEGTLYDGEHFQLQFQFDTKYPFTRSQNIPVHPHGHICLSILTIDWSPALTVQSKIPLDDSMYLIIGTKNPKETKWWYHDNNV